MKIKSIFKKLILPIWLILLLCVVSAAGLAFVFANYMSESAIAYAVYVFSFYSLSVLTVYCVLTLPAKMKEAKTKVCQNKLGHRYMTDASFRTHASLFISLSANLAYIIVNIYSGAVYNTRWFFILAVYYAVMASMRLMLALYMRAHDVGESRLAELKRARVCAYTMTLINFSLSAVVLMMMYQNRGFEYKGMLIYAMAAYTFYIATVAIVNIVKYRRYNSPVLTMAKCISLTSALVSMLSLETAMLSAFGADMPLYEKRLFIALTGAGVSVVVLGMSCILIVMFTKEIRKIRGRTE